MSRFNTRNFNDIHLYELLTKKMRYPKNYDIELAADFVEYATSPFSIILVYGCFNIDLFELDIHIYDKNTIKIIPLKYIRDFITKYITYIHDKYIDPSDIIEFIIRNNLHIGDFIV